MTLAQVNNSRSKCAFLVVAALAMGCGDSRDTPYLREYQGPRSLTMEEVVARITSNEPQARWAGLWYAGQHGIKVDSEILRAAAMAETDRTNAACIGNLLRINRDTGLLEAYTRRRKPWDPYQKIALAHSVKTAPGPRPLEVLGELAQDPDEDVREAAYWSLAGRSTPEAHEIMRKCLDLENKRGRLVITQELRRPPKLREGDL